MVAPSCTKYFYFITNFLVVSGIKPWTSLVRQGAIPVGPHLSPIKQIIIDLKEYIDSNTIIAGVFNLFRQLLR